MTVFPRRIEWLVVLLAQVLTARAAFEFSAYMQVGGQARFVVTDLDDHASSGWVEMGQSFHGCDLVGFDSQHEVLSLRKDGAVVALTLKGAHVLASDPIAASGLTPEDLTVRQTGSVRITLAARSSGDADAQRFIIVYFDNGTDRAGIQLAREGPRTINRALVPESLRSAVTDADIAALNVHLANVRSKWLGVVE